MSIITELTSNPLRIYITTIVVCVIIISATVFAILIGGVYPYLEGFYSKQTFEKTIHIDKLVEGKQLERNPGFIDSDGVGYISLDMVTRYHIGGEYNITYFCDDNNLRKVVLIKEVSTPPPTPIPTLDVFKCVNVSGVCR